MSNRGLGNKGLGKMGLSNRVVDCKKVLIEQQWVHIVVVWGGGGEKQNR